MNRSYSKIRHIQESNQILESRKLDEQVMNTVQNYIKKGMNMLQGKTGNKFWDAALSSSLGEMKNGTSSNNKIFCMDGSCENSITIFSDGRVVFEQAEFEKETPGNMLLNPDGSFYFKWNDGSKSKKHLPK